MTEKYATPHVHTALGAILNDLSVEKNGKLPSNMGGKPYISAVDLSLEIKRKFVEHNLILLPTEHVVNHNSVTDATKRITFYISINGEYTILSTTDGSSVTIGGVGDGVAMGSAVAANIASTNALKNALLRTFLVTEQSVEDEAKNGPKQDASEMPPAPVATGGLKALQDDLRKRSQKAAPDGRGKEYIEKLIADNPDKFADAKGELPTFNQVWKSEAQLKTLDELIPAEVK